MKRKPFYDKYRQRLGQVLGSPTPWVFLLGALGLGLIGEGTSKLIDALMENSSPTAAYLTLGIGVALIVLVVLFANLPQMMWSFVQAVRGVPGQRRQVQVRLSAASAMIRQPAAGLDRRPC